MLLAMAEQLAEALLAQAETGLIALDAEGRVALLNAAALDLLGLDGCQEGDPIEQLIHRADALAQSAAADLLPWCRAPIQRPLSLPRQDGTTLVLRSVAGPDHHLLLALTVASAPPVPELHRDPLTGLPDRSWFVERLAALCEEPGANPAVLMIDLDRFKTVNDSLGHGAGDALLLLVAKRLRSMLRDGDVVSRVGGDQFAAALRRPIEPDIASRRIAAALSEPYRIEGATASIGACVGVALAPDHGGDARSLLRAAETALYAAKDAGHGATKLFTADLDRSARERHTMIDALRRAPRSRQLELHYQPYFAAETGQIVGYEALVRWRHPELGLLLPAQFIPLADETDLAWHIGEWILSTACEDATSWPPHLSVCVNVSPHQLLDCGRLARTVNRMLLKSGLPPRRLELDIPEPHYGDMLDPLAALHATGLRLNLDDFGTGALSLPQLRRLPLDTLKLARILDDDPVLRRAAIAFGRTLGLTTLAKGIETEAQRAIAVAEGCQLMQGFLLGPPSPKPDPVGRLHNFATTA